MTDYLFSPPDRPSLPIRGSDKHWPVRRIFCVGRNYAEHAREMGNDPDREPPFFFTKPADAIVQDSARIPFPPLTENLHYEAELVVAIDKGGTDIPAETANDHIFGYAAGNDLTRRDLQAEAKSMRRPWDWGKAFDRSAPCSEIVPVSDIGILHTARLCLTVNGDIKQDSDIDQMIWSVPEIIEALSRSVTLEPGDLIFTGTPEGVGQIEPGDTVVVSIENVGKVTTTIG
jgi:fumarylpyruvate hydrolase